MKYVILSIMLVSFNASATDFNKVVACTKFGTIGGEVRFFQNYCPLGWIKTY